MSTSIDLHRPLGQHLVLHFNTDGSLSKAMLITPHALPHEVSADMQTEDVTQALRYLREGNAVSMLATRGFLPAIDEYVKGAMPMINEWAKKVGFFPFAAQLTEVQGGRQVTALLSDERDTGAHPILLARAVFVGGCMDPSSIRFY